MTHISKKLLEAGAPLSANRNATAAVSSWQEGSGRCSRIGKARIYCNARRWLARLERLKAMSNQPPDRPSILQSIPTAVATSLNHVPPDRTGAFVMGLEWKYGLPFAKFGTALRVGDSFKLAADAETRFSKLSTNATFHALWTWLLLLTLWAAPAFAQPTSYSAELQRVIDGDTFVMRVNLGFSVSITVPIRLAGLDTPERFTPEGRAARSAAEAFLKSGRITITPTGVRTFERHVAHVSIDGKSLADLLRAAGHVKK